VTPSAAPTAARAAAGRRGVRAWCGSMVVPLFDELFEPAAALGAAGGGVDHERHAPLPEVDVGGEVPRAKADKGERLRAGRRGHGRAGLVGGLRAASPCLVCGVRWV